MSTAEIMSEALKLPSTERARVAQQLLRSLDPSEPDPGADAAWQQELLARSDALHNGSAPTADWRDAVSRVRAVLAGDRT
jgi:putative addiction module component (TIGR02574 family)